MASNEQKAQMPTIQGFFGGASEALETVYRFGVKAQERQDALDQELRQINGVTFFWNRSTCRWQPLEVPLIVPDDEPVPAPIKFFTLDGLIDYIRENVEGTIPSKDSGDRLILQVVNETTVKLRGKPTTNHKERNIVAYCEAHIPDIIFGRYMDAETFNTMLLSKFVQTATREELFKVLKSLTNEQSMQVAEDGVSQVITVKQGVSLASNCQFKNPVPLAPMRTFTEIEQPESNFVLRVDKDASISLFEADGGAWKNEAVARIKEYLKQNLDGYPVVVLA